MSDLAWPEIELQLRANYAYLDRVDDVEALFAKARQSASSVSSVGELGIIVETLGFAFRDGHFHIRPVDGAERAWIPSSSDFWVRREANSWVVADVNARSKARNSGVRPGWEVRAMDGQTLDHLAKTALAPVTTSPTDAQLEYAANVVLTGRLGQARAFQFVDKGQTRTLDLPPAQQSFTDRPEGLLQTVQHGGIVRFRFNNSLGENSLIEEFDAAIDRHSDADAFILDLRDTPGGGNTTVARAILGHFVSEPVVYQIHRNTFEEVNFGVRRQYAEFVFPRGQKVAKPVVVLAGRWTGSVGEALAMAFDVSVGAHTIGTPLADLLGTLNRSTLDNGCMSFAFAWDKLFSSKGMPREDWVPAQRLPSSDTDKDGEDPALKAALRHLTAIDG